MTRAAAGPRWKPKRCYDCGKPHPSFNRDGGRDGTPWRCGPCDAVAEPLPPPDLFAAPPPKDDRQGALL